MWVIPSVIHYEALSLFPAQWRVLGSLCMTLDSQKNRHPISALDGYAAIQHDLMIHVEFL